MTSPEELALLRITRDHIRTRNGSAQVSDEEVLEYAREKAKFLAEVEAARESPDAVTLEDVLDLFELRYAERFGFQPRARHLNINIESPTVRRACKRPAFPVSLLRQGFSDQIDEVRIRVDTVGRDTLTGEERALAILAKTLQAVKPHPIKLKILIHPDIAWDEAMKVLTTWLPGSTFPQIILMLVAPETPRAEPVSETLSREFFVMLGKLPVRDLNVIVNDHRVIQDRQYRMNGVHSVPDEFFKLWLSDPRREKLRLLLNVQHSPAQPDWVSRFGLPPATAMFSVTFFSDLTLELIPDVKARTLLWNVVREMVAMRVGVPNVVVSALSEMISYDT